MKAKNKGGRPRYEIDYKTLDGLCEIMCTQDEITHLLKVDHKTLTAALVRDGHEGFSQYYKKKSADGKKSLRRVQYEKAIEGNTTMLVWLGKQLLDQKDKSEKVTKKVDLTEKEMEEHLLAAQERYKELQEKYH